MRNYTAQGELKTSAGSATSGAQETFGGILAKGAISPLTSDPTAVALLQALSAAEDSDGIALAQAVLEDTALSLEVAAAELIPPRPITLTSVSDLSSITFAIEGKAADGSELSEEVAGPAGAPADSDGIAESQAPTEDTPLSLEVVAAALDPPRALTFTSSSDLSGVNFEIVGLDENGEEQTVAAFAGPNNETLTTSELWSSITSITPDATDAGTLTVGWPDTSATIESSNSYSAVLSITPDANDAGQVEAGWLDSVQAFALVLEQTTFDPPRPISLSSTDDLSGVSFQIVGTDAQGAAHSEVIDGPNDGTVVTSTRFATITSITPLTLGSGDVSAGWPTDTFQLYQAAAAVKVSHLFIRNTNAITQTVELELEIEGEAIPWRRFELAEHESASVLFGEQPLPLDAGVEIRATATTDGAVSFSMHGVEQV